MKKAWIENNKVRDISNGNPAELFHPYIALHFDTDVDDTVEVGAELIEGAWVNPAQIESVEAVIASTLLPLSPVEFKMLFSSAERISIKASADPIVIDFFELINDPRLTQVDRNLKSVQDAVHYLVLIELITSTRAEEILS